MNSKNILSSIIWVLTAGSQLLATLLLYDPEASSTRANLGWLLILASAVLVWLPVFTLRGRGVIDGESYIDTTALVDRGIYSIVRHPQYLAGMLISIAAPLITWHWLVVALGIASLGLYWWSAGQEEEDNLEKFGAAYRDYQQRVPRFNFILGLIRKFRKQKGREGDE